MASTNDELGSDEVDSQAALWWSSLQLGTADREAFQRWRNASPAHAVAFARVQATWEALADQGAMVTSDAASSGALLSRRRLLRFGAASAITVAAGGMFFASRALAWDHARTGIGELRRITLPDASTLELNTDTAVSWKFRRGDRKIRLEHGEIAIFLGTGAPATLLMDKNDLILSAGSFNARLVGDKVGLTVLVGHALVDTQSTQMKAAAVQAGHQAELTSTSVNIEPTTIESRALLTAWQSGDIIFQDDRLQDAVSEYNRYLTRKIVVAPALRDMRVGGRFTTSDPTAFLQSVAAGLDVNVRTTPEGVEITPEN